MLRARAGLVVFLSFGALEASLGTSPEERPERRKRLERNLVLFTLGGMAAFAGLVDDRDADPGCEQRH